LITFFYSSVAAKYPNQNFLGTRKPIPNTDKVGDYEWESYSQVAKRRDNFASGLVLLGAKPTNNIGIYSINRAEWLITDLACQAIKCPSVALYDTLGCSTFQLLR
jgi:long-chain acyl-CoA synthetase